MAIESLLLTCVIDARENRDVAVVDISGAFTQVDMDELMYMRLDGKMAEIMVRIDPELYAKFVVMERGKKVILKTTKRPLTYMLTVVFRWPLWVSSLPVS